MTRHTLSGCAGLVAGSSPPGATSAALWNADREEADAALLPRLRAGEPQAFEAFVRGAWPDRAEVAIERREAGDFVRACIQELPERHRTVLILRDLDKRSGEETARILGLTRSDVKARLRWARRALRSLLEPRFPRHADGPTEPAEKTTA